MASAYVGSFANLKCDKYTFLTKLLSIQCNVAIGDRHYYASPKVFLQLDIYQLTANSIILKESNWGMFITNCLVIQTQSGQTDPYSLPLLFMGVYILAECHYNKY